MSVEQKTVNTIRILAADMVQKANSGHPGAPMGMAPMAYSLWFKMLKHDPSCTTWPNRDRFVLSSGHASALLYSLLHLSGYPLSMDDLKNFRQWGSKTPGHPEHSSLLGIETTTGPLGQGIANAVGMAIAETMLAERFNRPGYPIVDHRTYVICGDGCMMEGISSEAASLAGTLKLSKLTILYDDNEISIEGDTDITFQEDVGKRFEAYGWRVIRVKDGNQSLDVYEALKKAQEPCDCPTLIICPTLIGYGSDQKQGKASAHGEPLGVDNLKNAKINLQMPEEAFYVSDDVYHHVHECVEAGHQERLAWEKLFADYQDHFPELASEWVQWHQIAVFDELSKNAELCRFEKPSDATRSSSGTMINRLAALYPNMVGGSADLAPSNKTMIADGGSYSAENRSGRNIHFGIREHAMGAICNGIALHGGFRVFCGTFLVFSDYMKHAIRMSALMKLPVTYVFTHDSIGVGEDGATHQPIEQLSMLRSIPDLDVMRPRDGYETCAAWLHAVSHSGPTCLILTRQSVPLGKANFDGVVHGAYIVRAAENPDVLLLASGSEVSLIEQAAGLLKQRGVKAQVVSVPCMEMFLKQSADYQNQVLPSECRRRLAVEAASTMPWYRLTGLDGRVIGMDHYGASAPASVLFKNFGFTADNIVNATLMLLK